MLSATLSKIRSFLKKLYMLGINAFSFCGHGPRYRREYQKNIKMLRNKNYLYGNEHLKIPAHLNYGRFMFKELSQYLDRVAIINGETGESITYHDFLQHAADVALSLKRMGVKRGDAVGICSEKRLDFLPTILGIMCSGVVTVPTDFSGGRANLLHRLKLAGPPKIMFCSPKAYDIHISTFKEVGITHSIVFDEPRDGAVLFKDFLTEHAPIEEFMPAPIEGDDMLLVLYSSGTTGLPKGIPCTSKSFSIWMHQMTDKAFYNGRVVLNTREWYYTYGLSYTMTCLSDGSTVVFCPRNDVPRFLDAIQKYKVQIMQLAPVTLTELVKSDLLHKYDVSSMELIVSASTPCSKELILAGKEKFPNLQRVCQLYGMSEAGGVASDQLAPKGPKFGSVGKPGAGFTLKVVDLKTRETLGPHQRGEICLQSLTLMPGYINDTAKSHLDADGFFATGDVAYYDEDGYIYIVDRIKELIKFDSFQVAPAELESVLEQHPLVQEAGVVGAPHAQYGEAPAAFVVLKPGQRISAEELTAYVDGQVSHRMRLAGGIRFIDELPRGANAKLDRKALKKLL